MPAFTVNPEPLTPPKSRYVWLVFFLIPIVDSATSGEEAWRIGLAFAGFAVYLTILLFWMREGLAVEARLPWWMLGVAVAITVALTIADRTSWGTLFPALGAMCSRLPTKYSMTAVFGVTGITGGALALSDDPGQALGVAATTLAVGFMVHVFRRLVVANAELHEAQGELARLAVADERARFARDLHDLLGHSLSVVAVKAELAGRLLPGRPDEAKQHVVELEGVAREALSEVREAVSGYRRPVLAAELAGARMALEAAGIEAAIEEPSDELPEEVEAVLAWTVREGTTNVIRHSGAKHCRIAFAAGGVEVTDDGRGTDESELDGHGLEGLRERAEALRGRVEFGPAEPAGFRLAVSVPL